MADTQFIPLVSNRDWVRFRDYYDLDKATGCWQWSGCTNAQGYGRFKFNGRAESAHRVAYWRHKGAISQGLELDHLCRNRGCVNPDHLEAVTHRVNAIRGGAITAMSEARRAKALARRASGLVL